tara:strand:- start:1280 stop:1585 length:306 start_codon:yes stop_codon:yes gene_type:complete
MKERTKHSKVKISSRRKPIFKALKYPEIPLSPNDIYAITQEGDRLDLMAHNFYGDIRLWWILAQANPDKIRRDSYNVKGGIEIRIPVNTSAILKELEKINK